MPENRDNPQESEKEDTKISGKDGLHGLVEGLGLCCDGPKG